jgi:hypothetical protein
MEWSGVMDRRLSQKLLTSPQAIGLILRQGCG